MNPITETQVRLTASLESGPEAEQCREPEAAARNEASAGCLNLRGSLERPAGIVSTTESHIHPGLIGGDVGCGMGLFKTDLVQDDFKRNRRSRSHFGQQALWENQGRELVEDLKRRSAGFDHEMGEPGGHACFVELLNVEEIREAREFKQLGLGRQQLVILVHSGSRGMAEALQRTVVDEHQTDALDAESFAAAAYLRDHDLAVCWAKANRAAVARRFAEAFGATVECLWDGCHNSITRRVNGGGAVWIHRQGAIELGDVPVVIRCTCGSRSYLVKRVSPRAAPGRLLANDSGRDRACLASYPNSRSRSGAHRFAPTSHGLRFVGESRQSVSEQTMVPYEESEAGIEALVNAGLAAVVVTFRPLLSYQSR
jgi:release factor H-coupled RctB family protein